MVNKELKLKRVSEAANGIACDKIVINGENI